MTWFLVLAVVWIACIVGLAGTVVYAVLVGRLPNKRMPVFRDENPWLFWWLVLLRVLIVTGMLCFAYYVASTPGIGLL